MSEENVNAHNPSVSDAPAKAEVKADLVKEEKPAPKVMDKSNAELADENHKFLKEVMSKKAKIQEIGEENAQLKTQLETIRTSELEQQGKWEQLYKSEKERAEKLESGILERENKMKDIYKVNAVSEHLKFKNPEYKAFIKRDAIELDDRHMATEDTLLAEIERIKQVHPELLDNRPKGHLPCCSNSLVRIVSS